MKKEELIHNVREKYDRMARILNASNASLEMPECPLSCIHTKHLSLANAWLDELIAKEWFEAQRARHCVSEQMWEMYDLGGYYEELQEVILWKDKGTKFRKRVRAQSRPDLFKKKALKSILTKGALNEINTKKG